LSQILKPKKGYKKVKWWFGKYEEIPEEWNVLELNQLSKVRQGLQIPISDRFNESGKNRFQYITVKSIHSNKFNEYIENPSKRVICTENDILFTRTGNTGEIITNIKGVFHNNFFLIDFDKKKLIKDYLVTSLKQHKIQGIIKSLAGTTTIPDLNHGDFFRLKITVPTILEQQKISSNLSNIDELITSTQKVIDQTKSLNQGLMQKLLTRGIDHTKFKKVNFGRNFISYEIPEEWELSRLGNHTTIHGRIGWRNLRSNEYLESGFLMLSVWSLVETSPYGIDFTEGVKRLSQFRYDESPEIQLQNNDILIAKDGDIGRIGFIKNLPEPATVNSHVVPVRVNDELVNPEFLYWFFKSKPFQTYCKSFTSGTTIPLFTQKDLKNCIIPIPKKEEQNKIVTILSDTDSRIISQTQYKEKLERLKKSLMQKLLTGQVRVSV